MAKKIAVVAANGKAGQLIVKEAASRGVDVTAFVRGENRTVADVAICPRSRKRARARVARLADNDTSRNGGAMVKRTSTKELIAQSLVELGEAQPVDKITVQDIADNCSVSKRTFYYHFADKSPSKFGFTARKWRERSRRPTTPGPITISRSRTSARS